ncbi:MAG: PAC2 family protein [Candidatus Bathyarchaeota archaeon]|nr:PAC2 family protein [Candidatus Bathyarchaeota archaeon]
MEVRYLSKPELEHPDMIAAWPGMGYIAKISADYLRRRLNAKMFAEVTYYHNMLVYNNGLGSLSPIRHRFYAAPGKNLVICVGDAQPSIPEESIKLAQDVVDLAVDLGVRRIWTMAAYPTEYTEEPQVFGVYTSEEMRASLEAHGIKIVKEEGVVNGLNGVVIGVAKERGIPGACLMGDIKYANVPQHLSSRAVLIKLASILGIELDTTLLEKRARRLDASIRKRLEVFEEETELLPISDKRPDYIS